MPEILPVSVTVRGQRFDMEYRADDPGEALASHLQMLTLALVALEDPRADAVFRAWGFRLEQGSSVIAFDNADAGVKD